MLKDREGIVCCVFVCIFLDPTPPNLVTSANDDLLQPENTNKQNNYLTTSIVMSPPMHYLIPRQSASTKIHSS